MADRVDSSVASIKDKEDLSFSPLPNYDGFSQAEKAEQGSIVQDVSPLEVSSLEEWKPSRQFKIIFLVQCVVQCAVALDATIFTTTLPNLAKALDIDATKAFWIATSFLLTSAIFQPPIASLSDIFGRRAVYFSIVALLTIGTVICCACNNIAGMLAGRAIQGIGGGGVYSLNLIILSDLVPLRERARYQGYLQLVFALGSNTAPAIGGALIENTTWRWLFIILLPFCILGLGMVPTSIKYDMPPSTLQSQLGSIDWIGMFSFVVSITTFLVGLSWAGAQYSWSSAATICPLVLGIVGVAGTILWEIYGAKKPFIRLTLFGNRSAIAAYICTMLMGFLIYSVVYYITLWVMVVKGLSNIMAGVAELPYGVTMVPVSGAVGSLISKTGKYQCFIFSGWIITTLGMGLLVFLDLGTSTVAYVFIFIVVGIGQGLLMVSLSAACQAIANNEDVAYASSMYAFARSLGLCFGVSIGGTIFQNFLGNRLSSHGLPAYIALDAEGFAPVLKAMAAGPEKQAILAAYAWAFRMLFATMTGISGIGLVLGFCIKRYSLDRRLKSEHVLKSEERKAESST